MFSNGSSGDKVVFLEQVQIKVIKVTQFRVFNFL